MTEKRDQLPTMAENGEKVIRVRFEDGSVWDIPAGVVAHHRARYYEEREGGDTYRQEFDLAMEDDTELLDWASGNMDWSDVAMVAQRQMSPTLREPFAEWGNAPKEVVSR